MGWFECSVKLSMTFPLEQELAIRRLFEEDSADQMEQTLSTFGRTENPSLMPYVIYMAPNLILLWDTWLLPPQPLALVITLCVGLEIQAYTQPILLGCCVFIT